MTPRAAIVALALAALAWPAPADATDPLVAILDQARGAPVEIFADVVFDLLDGNKLAEKDRANLLEEVFLRAAEAREPVALMPAAIAYPPGIPLAGGIHLDALAIRCRAVRAMLAIDPKRARDLFSRIAAPEVPKPDCSSAILTDPTIYFDTLADVVAKAKFTEEERKKQAPFWMLDSAVRGIHTSLEVIAAARNFPQLVVGEKDAATLAAAFAVALDIDDSNRNFSAAMRGANLVGAVLAASASLGRRGAQPGSLLSPLRGYLAQHLSAPRCLDTTDMDYWLSLNAFHKALGGQTVVAPISVEESTPAKSEGEADKGKTVDQAELLELQKEIAALAPARSSAHSSAELPAQTTAAILAKVRDWKGPADEDPVQVFHQKAGLYSRLMFSAGAEAWPSIVAGLISTLEDPAILTASPADWLSEARSHGPASTGPRNKDGVTLSEQIGQAMRNSQAPTLAMYGRLEEFDRARH